MINQSFGLVEEVKLSQRGKKSLNSNIRGINI